MISNHNKRRKDPTMKVVRKTIVILMVFCFAMLLLSENLAASEVSKETLELIKKVGGKEKYEDANSIIILDKTDVVFNADGTAITENYSLVKVLTQAGLEENSEKRV